MPRFLGIFLLALGSVLPASANPLIARFQSVLGDFDVVMASEDAPISVANFTSYADRGSYDNTFIHRSTTYNPNGIQIVQGGGFTLLGTNEIGEPVVDTIPADPPIALEAVLSNVRGTIAMARTADPDSATSQWYFNVTNNPGLDFQYAVFGSVLGSGLNVIDAMSAVDSYDLGGVFSELPLLQPFLAPDFFLTFTRVRVAPFSITNITRNGNSTELHWQGLSSNTPVRVERSTNLGSGPWTAVGTNLTAGDFTDTNAPSGSVFYRVVIEPAP